MGTREVFDGPITVRFSSPAGTGENIQIIIQYLTGDQVHQSSYGQPFAVWTEFMTPNSYTFVDDFGDQYLGNSAPISIGYFDANRQFVSSELAICLDHHKEVASVMWGPYPDLPWGMYPGAIIYKESPSDEYHFVESGESDPSYDEDDKLKAARVMWLLANAPTSTHEEKLNLQIAIWETTRLSVSYTHEAGSLQRQAQAAVSNIFSPAEPVFSITTSDNTVEPDETIEFTIEFDIPDPGSPDTHPARLQLDIPNTLQVLSTSGNGNFNSTTNMVNFPTLPGTLTLTVKSLDDAVQTAKIQAIYDEEESWNITNLNYYISCASDVQNFVGLSKNTINHPYREAEGNWSEPLPVTLTHFTAIKENNQIALNWATATEEQSKGFEVQRSVDTRNWTKLDFIESKGLNGDSKQNLDYTFYDKSPVNGNNYYRLKQIDLDGTYAYSPIRSAAIDINLIQINTYPNPVVENLTIDGLKGEESIKIFNSTGRLLLDEINNRGNVKKSILMNSFADGIYIIQVTDNSGMVQTRKVLKAK